VLGYEEIQQQPITAVSTALRPVEHTMMTVVTTAQVQLGLLVSTVVVPWCCAGDVSCHVVPSGVVARQCCALLVLWPGSVVPFWCCGFRARKCQTSLYLATRVMWVLLLLSELACHKSLVAATGPVPVARARWGLWRWGPNAHAVANQWHYSSTR